MKCYLGSLLTLATMVAYSSSMIVPCTQPLEIRDRHNKILVHKYKCNQQVNQTDLQDGLEVYYDAHLPMDKNITYTLFMLENTSNPRKYKIHWFLTNIIPMNKSLTYNKTTLAGFKPPTNNHTATYTVLLFRHYKSLHLQAPSYMEMDGFFPDTWAAPIPNITLENNCTFHVTGKSSHPHSHGTIHPHHPSPTYMPAQTHPSYPTFHSPTVSNQPPYVTQTITEKKPGYHDYNSNNNHNTNHISPSHPHKSGASSNFCTLIVMLIPLISVIKVIF